MKILYVAPQRDSAERAAHALRTTAPNVKLIWAQTAASALRWTQEHHDVAAFWLDAQVQSQGGPALIECVRGLLKTAPVMVVVAEDLQSPLSAIKALASERTFRDRLKAADQEAQQQLTFAIQHAEQRAAKSAAALQSRLQELEAALRHAEQRHTSEAAASVEHLAQRHAEFTANLAQAARSRDALAQQLSAATAALDEARRARTEEVAAAAERLAKREAELGDALTEVAAARAAAEQEIERLHAALRDADARRTTDAAEHADQRAKQAAEHAAALQRIAVERDAIAAESFATRSALERRLDEAEAAHQQTRERAATDLVAARQRHDELTARLAQEDAERTRLAHNLAETEAARRDADERRTTELAAAAAHAADLRTQYDEAIARIAEARDGFERQAIDVAAALEQTRHEYAAEIAAAAERLRRAEQQAADERKAAAEREDALDERLAQEAAARAVVDRDLADLQAASARSRRRLLAVAAEVRRRTREQRSELEAQLAGERAERQTTVHARDEEIRQLRGDRDALQQSLLAVRAELQHRETELQRLTAEYDQARQSLAQMHAAFATLERASSENAAERARLESVVADRDAQLSALAEDHLAAEQAWKQNVARVEETLRLTLDANTRDIAARERQLDAVRHEVDVLKTQNDRLRETADRLPVLQKQIDDMQRENRRQFHRSPFAMCRCTREGTITHVNRSLVEMLGYRTADELRRLSLASDIFDAEADLKWLIERSSSTGALESVETTWKKSDRSRMTVRLHVLAAGDESLEVVAEDVTRLRAVEERLRQAQRMEAVGRLASEVAVTCDNLLRDVSQGGQEWLASIGSDPSLRHQGEQLLGEVTRAASFLRQFAIYGNKQISALEPVDVQKVLRELAPVLTRVAGDDIELELPKSTAAIDVDVDRERVERVLVNVASYARQRMPLGGRVKIDLASTVVDRGFVAKYPNVRPGAHALITVTEVRSEAATDSTLALVSEQTSGDASGVSAEKPGVDLSALLQLIRNCGGHLWVTAEPTGNMTLKIRLPKRAPDVSSEPAATSGGSNRGRSLAKWFRH
jgi:signal transduction histidine kinase